MFSYKTRKRSLNVDDATDRQPSKKVQVLDAVVLNEPHGICKSSSDTPTTLISSPSFSAAVSIDTNTSLDTESYHDTIDVDSQSEEFSHDAESGAEECLFSPNAIALVDPDQNSDSEDDAGKNANSKPYASGRNCLDLTLPPISDIREIFLDITLKALKEGLSGVIEKFVGKQINVATLCSGTESPLLAMTLVQQSLKELGLKDLPIHHTFSCEIDPEKQAYIERNFKPPLLFRDVREFRTTDDDYSGLATTAYGAREVIPAHMHLLIAGSSCVDYSNLNNKKTEDGESKHTFQGVLDYCMRERPAMVILENVCNQEAWIKFKQAFDEIGYTRESAKVDTKDYYIPHTRQRTYMLCLDKRFFEARFSERAVKHWAALMQTFERRASAPVTAFLLPESDPRSFIAEKSDTSQSGNKAMGWEACRGRHEKARREYKLGSMRPFSKKLPEFSDKNYLKNRPERDRDLLDIARLRSAKTCLDFNYKTRIIDLSQNVDRVDRGPMGVSGCLAPRGMPWISDQGRRLTGYESLKLQGIPIDEVSFTTQPDAFLKDLAGNAMSSTIVGPAILAALIVTKDRLFERFPTARKLDFVQEEKDPQWIHETDLERFDFEAKMSDVRLKEICADAHRSAMRCICEGRLLTTNAPILKCIQCGHTVCRRCHSNPEHVTNQIEDIPRISPHTFLSKWTHAFPLQIRLTQHPNFEVLFRDNYGVELVREYSDSIVTALENAAFTLGPFERKRNWIAVYSSSHARLELILNPERPYWRLFVSPNDELPAQAPLRNVLNRPIARAYCSESWTFNDDVLSWEWLLPYPQVIPITVQGTSPRISWRANMGLKEYATERVWGHLSINTKLPAKLGLPDLSGDYIAIPDCGTACDSLYKKLSKNSGDEVYLFLDPDPIGDPNSDCFVFASNPHRLDLGEYREIIASVESTWRPWHDLEPESHWKMGVSSPGTWLVHAETSLQACTTAISYDFLNQDNAVTDVRCCEIVKAVVSATAQVEGNSKASYAEPRTYNSDDKAFLNDFRWLTTNASMFVNFSSWHEFETNIGQHQCKRCSPKPPAIRWREDGSNGGWIIEEDLMEAANYERKMKSLPQIFDFFGQIIDKRTAKLKIGINIATLAHRAMAKLPANLFKHLHWNFDMQYREPPLAKFPKAKLCSNAHDLPATQPPLMKMNLRNDQLRSLGWMIKQESSETQFRIQEIEEALVPELSWKLEVRASADFYVKGGILADQPSYGKTVTSLALIHDEFERKTRAQIVDDIKDAACGLIHTPATLIITPSHLVSQWKDEISKFFSYKAQDVVTIWRWNDLQKYSIENLVSAKIVLVSWDILRHEKYLNQLGHFTALPEPSISGREFSAWLQLAVERVPVHIEQLKKIGLKQYAKWIKNEFNTRINDEDFSGVVPSKRLKGKKYRDAMANAKKRGTTLSLPPKMAEGTIEAVKYSSGKWNHLKMPLLQMFRWNRVIVDEYTLLRGAYASTISPVYSSITHLNYDKCWILSGTPKLGSFAEIKVMAKFMGIHLGIDDYTPGTMSESQLKNMYSELSAAERFETSQRKRSAAWHSHRTEAALRFLEVFVRQNDAELGTIPCIVQLCPVTLHCTQTVLYEELSAYLTSRDSNRKATDLNFRSDRERRVNAALEATTPEESLIHNASIFPPDLADGDGQLYRDRREELETQKERTLEYLTDAYWMHDIAPEKDQEKWAEFLEEPVHDPLAKLIIRDQFALGQTKASELSPPKTKVKKDQRPKVGPNGNTLEGAMLALRPAIREMTSTIRSIRFLERIDHLRRTFIENDQTAPHQACSNPDCAGNIKDIRTVKVFIGCGHAACDKCYDERPLDHACVSKYCGQEVRPAQVKIFDHFNVTLGNSGFTTSFGAKLDAIVKLLHSIGDEQVVLFAQTKKIMDVVEECFCENQIKYYNINGESPSQDDRNIRDFKENCDVAKRKQVLLLLLGGEHSTGLNLVNANHIIYLSPYFASRQDDYDQYMLQSLRRCHRTGQTKPVHVYRFFALRTIDVDILEHRERSLKSAIFEQPSIQKGLASRGFNDQMPPPARGPARLVTDPVATGKFALVPESWADLFDASVEYKSGMKFVSIEEEDMFEVVEE